MTIVRRTFLRSLRISIAVVVAIGCVALMSGTGVSSRSRSAPVATRHLSAAQLLLAASTAGSIHLRVDGVTTGPPTPTHSNDIPISAMSYGVSRFASLNGTTRTLSPVSVQSFNLTHAVDAFSLPLLNSALHGAVPGVAATLFFTNLSGVGGTALDYLQIDLGQTLITSFQSSASKGVVTDAFSLDFVTMTFTYRVAGQPDDVVTFNRSTGQ